LARVERGQCFVEPGGRGRHGEQAVEEQPHRIAGVALDRGAINRHPPGGGQRRAADDEIEKRLPGQPSFCRIGDPGAASEQVGEKVDRRLGAELDVGRPDIGHPRRFGIGQPQQPQPRRTDHVGDKQPADRQQARFEIALLGRTQPIDRHDPLGDRALQRRLEQAGLVAIARIDGALGHAGGLADRLDRGALETQFEKQVERLVEQFLVGQRRAARPPLRALD
jgi:hypothetical protein